MSASAPTVDDQATIRRLITASMSVAEELEHQADAQRAAVQRLIDALNLKDGT